MSSERATLARHPGVELSEQLIGELHERPEAARRPGKRKGADLAVL